MIVHRKGSHEYDKIAIINRRYTAEKAVQPEVTILAVLQNGKVLCKTILQYNLFKFGAHF